MSRPASLLRALKEERTNVYRLIGLVLFAATNLLTVITLHFHHDGQLRYLQIINLATGIVITATVIYGAFDMSKRSIKYEKVKKEKAEIHSKFIDSQQLLFRIDNQTRQEVGAWLHGTLQPQLVRLAKNIREKKETDCNIVSQQVDDICENFVRAYSHELFPPALYISLEVALETLLEGRAELIIDEQLTNVASFGFSVWSPESGLKGTSAPIRLVLDVDRRYAVYRIIEEAVANAEKKSSTSRIIVDLSIKHEKIRISIRDNGAPVPKNAKPGLGHSIINTFVKKFDGSFSLENVVDGVELIALIPYAPVTAAEHLNRRFHGEGQSA